MKKDFKISRLAIICVLCTTVSGAYAASTVRTLGGAGTYDSVSSASSSSGASSATARGGTVRISPTASSSSSSSGRVTTTTPRLSIGKYLGGGTSVSGGSTIISQKPGGNVSSGSSGGSMDPGVASDLEKQIEAVREDVTRLGDDVKDVQDNKQNILGTGDDYISIENDEIFVNLNPLGEALAEIVGEGELGIEMGNVDGYISWRHVGDSSWNNLISIEDITGPQGPQGEQGDVAEVDLTNYPTKDDMEDSIIQAVSDLADVYATKAELADYVKTEVADATYATKEEVTTGLNAKANVSDVYKKDEVYTIQQVDEKVANVVTGDLGEALVDYVKTEDFTTALEDKADTEYVDSRLQTKADVTTVSSLETEVGEVSDLAEGAAIDAANALSGLATKADKSELANYATAEQLAGKADAADLATKEDKDNKATTIGADNQSSSTAYPSVGAIVEWTNKKITELSDTGLPVNPDNINDNSIAGSKLENGAVTTDKIADEAITEDKLSQDLSTTIAGKEDKSNMIQTVIEDETKYPSSAAVYRELETKAFASDLENYATKEELGTKADTSALEGVSQSVTKITQQVEQITNPETGLGAQVEQAVSAAESAQSTAESAQSIAESTANALAGKQDKLSYVPEDSANKATMINDGNKASTTAFPSVGAVTEWTEQRINELSTEGLPVNPDNIGTGAITEEKLASDSVSTLKIQDGAVTEEKLSTELQESIDGKVDSSALGALAYESEISNAQIAADAGIEKTKLSTEVQASLDKADAAVSMVGAGTDAVLGVDSNGDKVWYKIAF